MDELTELPNIGETLKTKLNKIGIYNKQHLIEVGSKNAIIKIATIENNGVCINMLYALEGAVQGVRWHSLTFNEKEALKVFYRMLKKQ